MMIKNGILGHTAFTGKERDVETGYGYFGARYMDHELMTMWLSVDPMADKYPSISPYAYCAWNPIKLVDPNGMVVDSNYIPSFVKRVLDPSDEKYNPAFAQKYKELNDDPTTIYRFNYKDKYDTGGSTTYGGKDGDRDIININFSRGHSRRAEDGCLLEETYHAYQFLHGDYGFYLDNGGNFISMIAFDIFDEVEAKLFSAQNCSFKTGYESRLLRYAKKNMNDVEHIWNYLMSNPSVDSEAYDHVITENKAMSDYPTFSYHDNGVAYHTKCNIVGRKTTRK